MPIENKTYTITDLSGEFDISLRTIRFYEEKELIRPERTESSQRIYSSRDRARLKLILRGKRLGFSLTQIAEMIGMASVNMNERDQIQKSIAYGQKKLEEVKQMKEELFLLEEDLLALYKKLADRLFELDQMSNGQKEPDIN
ncbi:MAG: MerR family transcriptional regulator [Proteobacteria bacterium]|nr:MerR family transcriptional regulator [Pseudomonadota bacterium]